MKMHLIVFWSFALFFTATVMGSPMDTSSLLEECMPQCPMCQTELEPRINKIITDCGHNSCIYCFVNHKYAEYNDKCEQCGRDAGTSIFKTEANRLINLFGEGQNTLLVSNLCDAIYERNVFLFDNILEDLELLKHYSSDKGLVIQSDLVYLLDYYLHSKIAKFDGKTPMEVARRRYFKTRLRPLYKYVGKRKNS